VTLPKTNALVIFKGLHLNHPEASQAVSNFTEDEKKAFDLHVEEFHKQVKEVSEQAFLEISMITAEHHLHLKPEDYRDWTIGDFRDALDAIEFSEYEQIHLMNLTGHKANKALLAHLES
jgi:hypothetical protein